MENEITEIETKITYLEASQDELNEVVIELRRELDAAKVQIEKLEQKVKDLMEEVGNPERPNTRPPHY